MFDASEIFLEYPHGLIEGIVVLLWIVDDFKEGFDDAGYFIELLLVELALFVEVLDWLRAVFHVHGDQILLVAHLCITYI